MQTADTSPPSPVTAVPTPASPPRIAALDVLRGFAVCGILVVNIEPVTDFRESTDAAPITLGDPSGWLQLFVQQRFFPIFCLLFGIGFSLLLTSAARRTARPRLLLLRRLLVLAPLGALHQVWHPGEALLPYALFGLLLLLPSSWLPRWTVALGAGVLVCVALLGAQGGLALVPGLLLLGSVLVRYGVVDRIGTSTRAPLVSFAVFALAAVPAVLWQLDRLEWSGISSSSAVAGFAMAGAYVSGLLVLMGTRARAALEVLFAPLGRMALTNYVSATPVMVLAGRVLDLPHSRSWTQVLLVCAAILLGQWVLSTLWLRRYRQGPLEWLWRQATWAQRQPLPRTAA